MRPIIVTGLGFGDEGKGTITDAVARRYAVATVVRHNGGPQCAHHVHLSDGRSHCFRQFGSGTFAGANTFLSRFFAIGPGHLVEEARKLSDLGVENPFKKLTIDGRCIIVTPWHQLVNQLIEDERGDARHGTCGVGFGEAVRESIEYPSGVLRAWNIGFKTRRELLELAKRALEHFCYSYSRFSEALKKLNLDEFVEDLKAIQLKVHIINTPEANALLRKDNLLFESGQGALLDEDFGFHPHTTWSRTTSANAVALLREAGNDQVPFKLGVTRTFLTRHGAGPLPEESLNLQKLIADDDNKAGEFQGSLRVAPLSSLFLNLAIVANNGINGFAVTHCDKIAPETIPVPPSLQVIQSHGKLETQKEFTLNL